MFAETDVKLDKLFVIHPGYLSFSVRVSDFQKEKKQEYAFPIIVVF